jgi:hypothetical protein
LNSIPILSLVVAAIAVVVGPLVSWLITRRQIESAQRIARRQVVAPMRQAWINGLRKLLAEMLSSSRHYYCNGYSERTEAEYRRMDELEEEIRLMLNPTEEQHQALSKSIRDMMHALSMGKGHDEQFMAAHERSTDLAQAILKAEWNRTKAGD